ncbi:hypothetical protein SAMN05216474_1770 [Lishizhenia tianjinensis]|uniref:Tetratricopeptide repeat-containing protein n=1 Tax=Lishizhenia tianjinensis TaxID=477690 RepID=A0A1I6ZZU2_9FLAO|nr:hypothetical protein [Lishizhenia tianjinensis]SFT68208.1 hypothetical protein SAMN05216474_1770 [Lishizhenia tianjinensis]
MKLPQKINEITIDSNIGTGVYPPNGFLMFEEANLGNGDCFGLYWEFGKEDQEPIICEMEHDEAIIVPRFSNLDKFFEWYKLNDYDWGNEEVKDENFTVSLLEKGKIALQQNNPQKALEYFKRSTENFGELSENWYRLATEYKRISNELEFQKCIINSILSNWAIQYPSQNAISKLKSLQPLEELENHPLIKYRDQLTFDFGGKKENDDYKIIKKIIVELEEIGEQHRALIMDQNYASMMYWETSSFQERHNFNVNDWRRDFILKTKGRTVNLDNLNKVEERVKHAKPLPAHKSSFWGKIKKLWT